MDPPLADDFDPYSLNEQADTSDDEGDDGDEYGDHDRQGKTAKRRPKRPARNGAPEITDLRSHENSMYQRILDFALSLIAPPRNANPEEMRRHAISLSVAIALIYAHIAIACGWAASIGLSGFASANSLTAVQSEVVDVRLTLYGVAIRDLHRSTCNAVNYEDMLALNDQLQVMKSKYQRATGVPYLLPACPVKL